MNRLRKFGLGRSLDGLSLFRRRLSNGLRSGDPPVPSSPAAAATKDDASRWVMVSSLVCRKDDSVVTDAKTMAESRTTTGCHLRVSMGIAPPPSSSFLYYDLPDCGPRYKYCTDVPTAIAAHGDSVLFEMSHIVAGSNYIVYSAGAVTRPPSLSLVPARIIHVNAWQRRKLPLSMEQTGILRRGEEEILVAHLEKTSDGPPDTADLSVFRIGSREWELKTAVPMVHGVSSKGDEPIPWQGTESDKVVPVGDRFLCWIHYRNGVLVCDMVEEEECPKFRYVPLPVVPPPWKDYYEDDNRPPIEYSRNMCSTGDGVLRFVSIDLRCCCGGFGMSTCEHSRYAFMVTTWSLSLSTNKEPMTWVKETVLHCEELWALPGYEGLPRVHPECPIMSLHNPDVVYFRVGDRDVWMVEVDTRSKTLLSVISYTTDAQERYPHLPVKINY